MDVEKLLMITAGNTNGFQNDACRCSEKEVSMQCTIGGKKVKWMTRLCKMWEGRG